LALNLHNRLGVFHAGAIVLKAHVVENALEDRGFLGMIVFLRRRDLCAAFAIPFVIQRKIEMVKRR